MISPLPTTSLRAPTFTPRIPSELKLEVMRHLTPVDLARVAQVDRSWAQLRTDDSLWQRQLVPPEFRKKNAQGPSSAQAFHTWVQTFDKEEKAQLRKLYSFEKEADCRYWYARSVDHPKLVWAAVAYFPGLLIQAPYALREDRALLIQSIHVDGRNIRMGQQTDKSDYELAFLAVSQNGWALEYLDNSLQQNVEIRARALLSVKRASYQNNEHNSRCASTILNNDKDFRAILLQQRALNP